MPGTAVVLGSGTSNGVPMLGIEYPDSFLADPRNHRTRCSLLLKGPGGNVLVDCTPEMRLQLLRAGVTDIAATFVTHTHADHIMGMDDLRSFCIVHRKAMPIYTSAAYLEDIRRVFPYAFEDAPPGLYFPKFEPILVPALPQVYDLCGLKIQTFWVEHGSIPCMGLRVNDFAYITDVSRIPPDVMPLLEGLEVLILDAVRHKPHPNHLHFDESVKVSRQIGAKTTYFTHLCDEYDHGPYEETLPDEIRLAYDSLEIPL